MLPHLQNYGVTGRRTNRRNHIFDPGYTKQSRTEFLRAVSDHFLYIATARPEMRGRWVEKRVVSYRVTWKGRRLSRLLSIV